MKCKSLLRQPGKVSVSLMGGFHFKGGGVELPVFEDPKCIAFIFNQYS